jgi:hypothetical protein
MRRRAYRDDGEKCILTSIEALLKSLDFFIVPESVLKFLGSPYDVFVTQISVVAEDRKRRFRQYASGRFSWSVKIPLTRYKIVF